MTRYALRIATIFIITYSLLFTPPIARAQDRPTEAEAKQAKEVADLFLKRLEETGDFSNVIDELYAGDFIERYLRQKALEAEESDSSYDITFAPGLSYKPELLKQATVDDWRRLYITTHNFFYHVLVIGMNRAANDYLNGREPADEIFDGLIPPTVITLFNSNPILKDVIGEDEKPMSVEPTERPQPDEAEGEGQPDPVAQEEKPQSEAAGKKSGPKSIETPEEMRSVTETLQEGLRLLLEAQDDHALKLTDEAKKAFERLIDSERLEPKVYVSDKECLGDPPGTRHIDVLTPVMFNLMLTEVDGKQRIMWATLFIGD